jgi:hypothetical protein
MTFILQSFFMWLRFIKPAIGLFIPFLVNAQVSSVCLTAHVPSFAENKNVYVAGSFNNWKAGDSLYKMKRLNATTYTTTLPVFKNVNYKYKYTLGQWNEVEIALNDSNINDRSFISTNRKKKITDTVIKWATPKQVAKQNMNPQMLRITAMKDSVLNGLQPKLNEMLQLLKVYTVNLLQNNPDVETDNRVTADVVKQFADVYGKINDLFHKIFGSLTTEQKQKILKALNNPGADKDFINTLGAAINDAMK